MVFLLDEDGDVGGEELEADRLFRWEISIWEGEYDSSSSEGWAPGLIGVNWLVIGVSIIGEDMGFAGFFGAWKSLDFCCCTDSLPTGLGGTFGLLFATLF